MANTLRQLGLRPSRYLNDAPYNGQQQLYAFSASNASACYKGDLVTFDATYRTTALTDALPATPMVAPVVAALTTTAFRGVVAGFVPQPEFNQTATASLGAMYRVASTARYVWIVDDPQVVYEAQEIASNSYTSATANATNKVADISYAAGNAAGISGIGIDGSLVVTNAVKPLRVLRYTKKEGNFNFAAADTISYAVMDVINNNPDLEVGGQGA